MELTFRPATTSDLPDLVSMLADDPLGRKREDLSMPLNPGYCDAFAHIDADPNNELVLACSGDRIVGMLQLTFIPYLTYTGSWRCIAEGVRVHKEFRGAGIGRELFSHAMKRARQRGCRILQLTSDKSRKDALRFYESLGFTASHEGFKLLLN